MLVIQGSGSPAPAKEKEFGRIELVRYLQDHGRKEKEVGEE